MKKILLTALVLIALFSTVGLADYTCSNSTTSHFTTTINVNGNLVPVSYDETCNFNCKTESGKCNPSPYDINFVDVSVMFIVFAIGLAFFYIHGKVGNEGFKLLYFMVGLMFLFASLLLAIILIQQSNKSLTFGAVETLIYFFEIIIGFSILVLFIFILVDAFKLAQEKKLKFW